MYHTIENVKPEGDPRRPTKNLRINVLFDCFPPAHTVDENSKYPPARVPRESYLMLVVSTQV